MVQSNDTTSGAQSDSAFADDDGLPETATELQIEGAGGGAPKTVPDAPSQLFWRRTLRVALWSVIAGVALEIVLLCFHMASAHASPFARFAHDAAGKVTWSFVVCLGLATAASARRATAQAMGWMGLIAAPLGVIAARSVHKGLGQALTVTAEAAPVHIAVLAGLKAVEYAAFGYWLGRITRDPRSTFKHHLRAGIVVGVVFAIVVVLLILRAKPDASFTTLAARAVSELLFPPACACVLYVGERATRAARA